MQTLRQRIEAVFRGETPDAMVWFGDLTYWYDAHAKIGDLPEKWQGKRGISFSHRQMNIGEYVPGCSRCGSCNSGKQAIAYRRIRRSAGAGNYYGLLCIFKTQADYTIPFD